MSERREVYVRNEQRADGNYSIYVRSGSNGSWYTGLTFGSRRDCDTMLRLIERLWVGEQERMRAAG